MRPFKFSGHKGAINEVAINPLGTLIASASSDETVRLWTNSVKGSFTTIKGHSAPVRSVDFSSDSRFLLTASNDKIIKIFNLQDNKKFHSSYSGHSNWVRSARFSPDNRLIGSCSDDHTVKIWDIAKRSVINSFIDHLDCVNTCRFSPDGTCIASGGNDRKIKIWDTRSGRLIQHYDAHMDAISCISYHPSGNYLISSSLDSTIKIWDLKLGQILYTVHGHEGPIKSVAFSDCGDYFCSGGVDSILMIWKSNIKNMDEEFNTLTKVKSGRVMSNKGVINEEEKVRRDFNVKTGGTVIKKGRIPPGQKCKVTIEKGIKQRLQNTQNTGINSNNSALAESNEMTQSQGSNYFSKLPDELSSTFDKMITQLDIVVKTMKIMEQRIQTVESQVTEIYQMKKMMKDGEIEEYHEGINDEHNDNNIPSQFKSTMNYEEHFASGNVFNQNLSDQNRISQNEPLGGEEEEQYQEEENAEEEQQVENINEENLEHTEPNNVPVEIFEDVGNHVEEFNNEEEHNEVIEENK